ncbi:DUF1883 domain-containing protein [Shinella sp. BYT-45]|uniref:DUF1883 domain-containing protein n=1 Tax=Shinella sp. BYT-45 TaxID=3377377 RepID=UPI0039812B73
MEIRDGRPSFWRERVAAYADTVEQLRAKVGVARSGRWHVAVDLGGYTGSVRAGIRVLG